MAEEDKNINYDKYFEALRMVDLARFVFGKNLPKEVITVLKEMMDEIVVEINER